MLETNRHRLRQRLLPLNISAFLLSCVFWYSIEKLFMTSIGLSAATIGFMAAMYAVATLVFETPSGLLADRWSRKGILIMGASMLLAASLIQGIAQSAPIYLIGTICWGISYALYSGTYDPIVYDTLLEESGETSQFRRHYGHIRILDGAGLFVSSLLGAGFAAIFGLRSSYLLTIPVTLLAIVALLWFREPTLHRASQSAPITKHVRTTLQATLHRGSLLGILLILVVGAAVTGIIAEFNQLWLIFLQTKVAFFGIFGAILFGSYGIAGLLAPRLQLENRKFVVVFTSLLAICGLIITSVHVDWLIILALSVISISLIAVGIIHLERLHDRLPSAVRSGGSSTVNSLGRIVFIGTALAFGAVADSANVFVAGWLVTIPLFAICIFLLMESD